jgi:hypothetical protein
MGKTKTGSKGPGFDYWSRRPKSSMGFGKWLKQTCTRIERRRSKNQVRRGEDMPAKEAFGG